MTEVLVEKVESNYTSNFWQGPCPNWLHLSWPPVWPTPHQTSKCMMVYHVLHVLLNLLFSTGKPRNVFLSVLRQETGFSRKDNSLTQTWVNPCWHCSWVCFDSKLDAAVLIVQWTKIWGGTIRLWTLDSSSYSNVPLTPSADENSTKLGAVHICPPQDKAATAYCLSWTKAQFKRMSENPEEYSTNQTEFLIAHFGWKDEERMICMFSQKKNLLRGGRKMALVCFFFSVSSVVSVLNKGVMNTFSPLGSWGEKDQRAHLPPDFHFHFHEAHWSADFHFLFLLKTENIPRPLINSALQIILVCRHFWLSRLMKNRTVSYWLGLGRTPCFFYHLGRI